CSRLCRVPAALEPWTQDLQASGDVAYIVRYDALGKAILTSGPEAAHVIPRTVNPQEIHDPNAPFDTVTGNGVQFYEMTLPILLPQGPAGTKGTAISGMPDLMP